MWSEEEPRVVWFGEPPHQPVHEPDEDLAGETVYVLGAGFNCAIPTLDGWHAPLATNTFRVAIDGWHPSRDFDNYRFSRELLAYIHHYWGLTPQDLWTRPFDIEECMSMLQLQRLDLPGGAVGRQQLLLKSEYALMGILRGHLTDAWTQIEHSPALTLWAQDAYDSGSTVLTFNYDTFAEQLIANASQMDIRWKPTPNFDDFEVPDEWLAYSRFRFNYALAYGIQFDHVRLRVAGGAPKVDAAKYYGHERNSLYTMRRVLKLHGSVNWFESAGEWMFLDEYKTSEPQGLILGDIHEMFFLDNVQTWDRWRIEPVVITPQVYKNFHRDPFPQLWREARTTLEACRRLIVIGYSLPPTDFPAARLMLEAFADTRIDELIVINPDETVAPRLERLVRPKSTRSVDFLHTFYGVPEVDEWGLMSQARQAELPKQPKRPLLAPGKPLRPWSDYWADAVASET